MVGLWTSPLRILSMSTGGSMGGGLWTSPLRDSLYGIRFSPWSVSEADWSAQRESVGRHHGGGAGGAKIMMAIGDGNR